MGVSVVPTVVVVNNKTGKTITDCGLDAIQYHSSSPKNVLDFWREGNSGVSLLVRATTGCNVM